MTDHLTPNQIVTNLLELARQLAELSRGMDELERDAVNKASEATNIYLKAFMAAEGPQYLREAMAKQAAAGAQLEADLAKCLVTGRRRDLETLRIRIDVGRSAAAALRSELALERAPQ